MLRNRFFPPPFFAGQALYDYFMYTILHVDIR